ncbi:MAG: Shedu anti-phage system protein SduA domain-containing protein [Bryobacteraceae bacterium]
MAKPALGIVGLKRMLRDSVGEVETQRHLGAHPWLLTAQQSAHPPLVISQFQLGSEFRPDFVFFWMNSGGEFIQLIEIESPKLLAFNASHEFSQKFNHAVQQVRDWPDWILRNSDLFERAMLPLFERGWITGVPSFTRARLSLIAGRRWELLSNPRRRKRWEAKASDLALLGVTLRTWDGFASSMHSTAISRNVGWITCVTHAYAKANDAP